MSDQVYPKRDLGFFTFWMFVCTAKNKNYPIIQDTLLTKISCILLAERHALILFNFFMT